MCYAVFLIHPLYITAFINSHQRQPVYITEFSFLTTYMGTLTVVFAFAAVVSVCVEMPFLNLNYLSQAYTDNAQQPACSMH